jgi:hypothetical protein
MPAYAGMTGEGGRAGADSGRYQSTQAKDLWTAFFQDL